MALLLHQLFSVGKVLEESEPINSWAAGLLAVWFLLLIPWFPFARLSRAVFDVGRWDAYMFVWWLWTYPVMVGLAVLFARKIPLFSFLPLLSLLGFLISGCHSSM